MISPKINRIWYGGDYNPDQWPEAVWDEDMRLFRMAGINVVTTPVFSWAKLQIDEETYDFSWLDRVIDKVEANGMFVCLATSTAAVPAWMATKYPGVLRVTIEGRRMKFGGRHNFCPNSPVYRRFSRKLTRSLAERYGQHPTLAAWHVNNEYGGYCYCENCEMAFRLWLRDRYHTLTGLNDAWNTSHWGHTFTDWDQVVLPSLLSEHLDETRTVFQSITLDYYRFNSDSLLHCFKGEYEELKAITPDVKVTTNFMGAYKAVNYFRWAPALDIVSWDSYPRIDTPVHEIAMRHDLMRGLKAGAPFMLMEQTPSQQNWQPYNSLKRPGIMRLWSWQAVAHGSDTVMFFQLRRSKGGCEKYHGALIEHAGHENTRVFRECAALGSEIAALGDRLIDSRPDTQVGILFDWENWWAVEMSSGPSVGLKYVDQMLRYYEALYSQNYSVDMIGFEADFTKYEVILAPVLYMVKRGIARKIQEFVRRGGTFLTTFFSGLVNENDLVVLGGYPGELRSLLAIWVEEIDALLPGQTNTMVMRQNVGELVGAYSCGLLCDLIHSEGADVLAEFGADFYAEMPCLTRNFVGKGQAWYVGTFPESRFIHPLIRHLCSEKGIEPVLRTEPGVEATRRRKGTDSYLFVLNHNDAETTVDLGDRSTMELLSGKSLAGRVSLAAKDVLILEEPA